MSGYPEMNGKTDPKSYPSIALDVFEGRNPVICSRCRNNLREVCFEQCQPAQDYHKLVLKDEATFPKVRFADTLGWTRAEKWAWSYICSMLSGKQDEFKLSEPVYRW
jgi:hypothetical protein